MSLWSTLPPIHINTNIIHILIFPFGHHHHCIEDYQPDFSPFQSSTFPSTLSLLNFVHIKIHSKRKILIFICLFLFYHLGVWDTFFTTLSIIITHSISLIFNIFKNNIFPSSFPYNCLLIHYYTLQFHSDFRFNIKEYPTICQIHWYQSTLAPISILFCYFTARSLYFHKTEI